jgi:hypothetical protein
VGQLRLERLNRYETAHSPNFGVKLDQCRHFRFFMEERIGAYLIAASVYLGDAPPSVRWGLSNRVCAILKPFRKLS